MLIYAAIGAMGFLFLIVMLFVGEIFGGDHDVGGHEVPTDAGDHGGPSWLSARIMAAFLTAFCVGGVVARYYSLSPPAASGAGGFTVCPRGLDFSAVTFMFAVLLGLLGVLAAMALFARNYIKVPPSMVAIFYGRKHTIVDEKGNRATVGFRVVRGGAALRVPLLEQVEYLSLNIMSIQLKIQRAYTKEGVPVTVEAVANVKIAGDDMSLRSASERFLGMGQEEIKGVIFQTLEGHLRAILGTLTVEEINADRSAFAQKMTDEAAVDLKKMGVSIDILT